MELEIDLNCEAIKENPCELLEIPRVSADDLSYNQFFHKFMCTNTPVLIEGIKVKTVISENWFDGSELKLENLQSILEDREVPVANCSKKYFDSHEKTRVKFSEYVKYWNDRSLENCDKFYLKDFHMKQEFPDLDFYKVPFYFGSDWLNEYLIDNNKVIKIKLMD